MPQIAREEDVRTVMQAVIDCCEGRTLPTDEEMQAMGLIMEKRPEEFARALILMCGTVDAAAEKLILIRGLIRMGIPQTTVRQ